MLSKISRGAAAGLAAVFTTLVADSAMGEWALNLPVGVTPISRDVYDLHMLILWICVIIGVIVFGAMFVSIVLHRKAAGHKPANFHHSTFAEIVWTVVPFVILVGLAIPATKTLIDMEDTSEAELTIKVTGYQWLWKYEYLEDGVSFYSSLAPSSRNAIYGDPWKVENYLLEVDNPMVLPVGKKIRFLLTADDVIHAWWVPALGMKKDAIPGFVNEIWAVIEESGTYRGQCAELCGKDHGFMPIVVEAKSEDMYKQWVATYKSEQPTKLAGATAVNQ
jgi:cytochrome c oxidase subunit 2